MSSNPMQMDVSIVRPDGASRLDAVTVEEPLEIWVSYEDKSGQSTELSLSITMRTPGNDKALVLGFLFGEGIISSFQDIAGFEYFGPITEPLSLQNQVRVFLKSGKKIAEKNFQRYFYSNSSCGICGKASIQALAMQHEPKIARTGFCIDDTLLRELPALLRASQAEYLQTGGLHGVSMVDQRGSLLLTREDVGRHNAMDKLIGEVLVDNTLSIADKMVLVSGRASFELVQKALMADIPFMAAIGAPSSAAIDLAKAYGMTLVGFLKNNSYNIYHCEHRIRAN